MDSGLSSVKSDNQAVSVKIYFIFVWFFLIQTRSITYWCINTVS